ncbi:MAG: hypothetical protein ACLGIN_10510 [Candidatus Sericytochromatia bacterium]
MASRILWFSLGIVAGSAYAARLVSKERLDLPPGTDTSYRVESIKVQKKENPKVKAAKMLEERATQLSDVICQTGNRLSELVYQQGQALAGKLRGEQAPAAGEELIPETVGAYPAYGSKTSAQEQVAATYGLEENR